MSDSTDGGSRQPLTRDRALHRELWLVALRLLVGCIFILLAYAMMPTKDTTSWWAAVPITVGCLVIFVVVFARQFRRVQGANYPVLRAVETLVFSLLIFLVLFASIAVQLDEHTVGAYNEALNKIDAFYFSVTTLATVGYGDIVPVSSTARVVVTIQMLANLALLGVALRLLSRVVESRVSLGRDKSQ